MITAIREKSRTVKGHIVWECICDCGKLCYVTTSNLKRQKTCGCKRHGKHEAPGIVAINRLYDKYKYGATQRNLEFILTKEDIRELSSQKCYYCDAEPSKSLKNSIKNLIYDIKYNGIDRIDNTIGYVVSNVRTCCTACNIAKASMTETEFFNLISRIATKHKDIVC